MIEASAIVERVDGGRAWVRLSGRSGGCGRCDEPGGCRSTTLAYALKGPNEVFSLPDLIGVRAGEAVRLRMQDGAPLRGALMGYGLGACLLVVGAACGDALASAGREDLFALVGGVTGLLGALAINRLALRSRRVRGRFNIEMVRGTGSCADRSGETA